MNAAEAMTTPPREKHYIITGGTGGLGAAVVGRLIEAGATCHVPWVNESELEHFPYASKVRLEEVDVTDAAAAEAYFQSLPALHGSIHLVGGFDMAPIEDTTPEAFEKMWRLNTLSCFVCCRAAIAAFRRTTAARQGDRPGGVAGRIVNVGARPAVQPTGGMTAYAVAKAGVTSLTQSLAAEVKDEGILVNAVLPSIMDTPGNRRAMPDADFDAWPKTEQVAEAIAWLIGPANQLTSGVLLPVYGQM